MNVTSQALQNAKLQTILHRAFVEIRNLALVQAFEQIHALADAVEIIPQLLTNREEELIQRVEAALVEYQSRYANTCYDYLSIWKMDETLFQRLYFSSEPVWGGPTALESEV